MFGQGKRLFENRQEAGERLAERLSEYGEKDAIVLGIPRGGIPVAAPVAEALKTDLDVMVAKKLGAPGNPELAIGAVGENAEPYLNDDVVESLSVDQQYLTEETKRQYERVKELASEFRDVKARSPLEGRTVILVDDGIATGATTRACLEIISEENPDTLVLAVPVAPARTVVELEDETSVDRLFCLEDVEGFFGGIGGYYRDFGQVSADEVREMLRRFNDASAGSEQ